MSQTISSQTGMTQAISISEALAWAGVQLSRTTDSPSLDAEVMLLHLLKRNRSYLYTWPDHLLTVEQWQSFIELVQTRVKGHPVAHITGEREFWSLPLSVNATTLIPRPDTEMLVETALNLPLADDAKVLDLGTGTGAIALALASERPKWQITAVDRVADAVTLAQHNRDKLGLSQVSILQSDWFSSLDTSQFQLIVSNPPYIDAADMHLNQGDVRFEPLSALTADNSGFADLFFIAEHARSYLIDNGYLLMEHGYQQAITLRAKLTELGYQDVATARDFGHNERCTLGRWV